MTSKYPPAEPGALWCVSPRARGIAEFRILPDGTLSTTPGRIPFSGVVTANDVPVGPRGRYHRQRGHNARQRCRRIEPGTAEGSGPLRGYDPQVWLPDVVARSARAGDRWQPQAVPRAGFRGRSTVAD
jgi:hypothetical protein